MIAIQNDQSFFCASTENTYSSHYLGKCLAHFWLLCLSLGGIHIKGSVLSIAGICQRKNETSIPFVYLVGLIPVPLRTVMTTVGTFRNLSLKDMVFMAALLSPLECPFSGFLFSVEFAGEGSLHAALLPGVWGT